MYRWSTYNDRVKSLQEPTFLILTALAAGPQHGYGVIGDVERISGGRVRLRAGTLYAALDRLTSDGLVEAEREEVVDGRLRRYYRLTEPGAARLATEAEHLRHNAETATTRLRLAGGTA
jgi:DNA-binding PadR family transcriptional regulator